MVGIPLGGIGQATNDSPYSSYGFGDLIATGQVVQATMGGVGVAIDDPVSVSVINPATFSALRAPVVELGVASRTVSLRGQGTEQTSTLGQVMGLSLGIPIGKDRWGIALGMIPVSRVGYRITDAVHLPDGNSIDLEYSGNGGMNRAFFGAGWALWQQRDSLKATRRLSVGANFNYVFGSVDRERRAVYPANQNYV
ncbi:MAG: hypothetical protein KDB88_04795, partial [Flavobacteriales bacterium]|nr:hypothetical protein [Flavobacteriales bacterium]